MCTAMHTHAYRCRRGQTTVLDPLELELETAVSYESTWVLGTELRSPERKAFIPEPSLQPLYHILNAFNFLLCTCVLGCLLFTL